MNNLTPLQEVASRIYCSKVEADGFDYRHLPITELIGTCINEARQLLEATNPEPLEWKPCEYNGKLNYSKGGEFCAYETKGFFKLVNEIRSTPKEGYQVGLFPTLDEAKQFAEHIRTR